MSGLIRPALVLFTLLSLLTGLVYPLVVTVAAQGLFPKAAHGSLIVRDGQVVGSECIGQLFSSPRYFWGRPSGTVPPYNGVGSTGSNLGPSNPALGEAVAARVAALRAADPGNSQPVPVDLVTASGSGLDPAISIAAALYQADRVARARGVPRETVARLIAEQSERPWVPGFGEPSVNVLLLNLALDRE